MRPICCTWIGVVAIAITLTACSRRERERAKPTAPRDAAAAATPSPDADPDAALAWYRVEAAIDDLGEVPFIIGVDRAHPTGVIYSADERLPLVVLERDPLVLRIPVRGVELRLAPDERGQLRGQWRVQYYFKRDFDIVAEPIAAPRPELLFPGTEPPAVDLAGTWKIDIHDFGVGRAIFRQDPQGTLTGTVIPPEIGDLRHLTGRVIGKRGELSVFDGIHGFHLELTASDDGKRLTGRWLIAAIGAFPFTATREDAPPTHLAVKARLAPGKTRIALPALDRPPYKGNPVIVDYFGSWCPVCMDLTPELVRLQREHAAAGLQILSIALEPEGDEAETKRRLEEFRTAFGVTWPFDIRFGDDFFAQLPKELVDTTGFPVTIFIRRDGTVAGVHTGFISAAAGAERAAIVQHFDELAREIVASPAPR